MKKYIYFSLFFFCVISMHSQRNGMSYQALIMDPNGEELPGYNNANSPLIDQLICIQFAIVDHNGSKEYVETQTITTDSYGMVNLTIGDGVNFGGYADSWNDVLWDSNSKELIVSLDISAGCDTFYEISNQYLHSVPFALYAASSGTVNPNINIEIWNNAIKQIKDSKELLDLGIITKKEYEKISKRLKKIIIENQNLKLD